jgi:stress-induced morphogen
MVTASTFDYKAISTKVKEVLEAAFPGAALETEEGQQGRVHVKVVSGHFNGKSEKAKQELVWRVLTEELQADAQAVSLVLAYGMDEIP